MCACVSFGTVNHISNACLTFTHMHAVSFANVKANRYTHTYDTMIQTVYAPILTVLTFFWYPNLAGGIACAIDLLK